MAAKLKKEKKRAQKFGEYYCEKKCEGSKIYPENLDCPICKQKLKVVPKVSLFDLINYLTIDKKKWEELTWEEQKAFNPFIINRFLSMDLYMCEAINDLQQWTIGMDKDKVWRAYFILLPQQKLYLKYIKDSTDSINEKAVEAIVKYYSISKNIAEEYFRTLQLTEKGQEKIKQIIRNYAQEK